MTPERLAWDLSRLLADHWPDPAFGCECTPYDEHSDMKAFLEVSWEKHLASLLVEHVDGMHLGTRDLARVWREGQLALIADSKLRGDCTAQDVYDTALEVRNPHDGDPT